MVTKESAVILLFKRLWRHIEAIRRKQMAFLLVIMVLASFAEVVSLGAVLPFLAIFMAPERVLSNSLIYPLISHFRITESSQLFLPFTVVFILAALLSAAMRLILLWVQTRLGFGIGADFSSQIYKKTLYQPYLVHVSRNSGEVITAVLTKISSVIFGVLLPSLVVASSIMILLGILLATIVVDPFIALVAFSGFGSFYGFMMLFTRKRLVQNSRQIQQESNIVTKSLQEGLGGIRDILIDGTQGAFYKIYRDADLLLQRSHANVQIMAAAPRFIIEAFAMVVIATIAYGQTPLSRGMCGTLNWSETRSEATALMS